MDRNSIIQLDNIFIRKAFYKAYKGECFYTGRHVDFVDMNLDHILPKNHGGENMLKNIVLTSERVNKQKNDRVDFNLVERMIYLNSILYTDMVIVNYEKLKLANDKLTQPKPIHKENLIFSIDNKTIIEFNSCCDKGSFHRPSLIRKFIKEYLVN